MERVKDAIVTPTTTGGTTAAVEPVDAVEHDAHIAAPARWFRWLSSCEWHGDRDPTAWMHRDTPA